jgi:hypothetical protein
MGLGMAGLGLEMVNWDVWEDLEVGVVVVDWVVAVALVVKLFVVLE